MPRIHLSLDTATIRKAKRIAERQHTSVSALFERFVALLELRGGRPSRPGPMTRKASGLVDIGDADERGVLAESLAGRELGE